MSLLSMPNESEQLTLTTQWLASHWSGTDLMIATFCTSAELQADYISEWICVICLDETYPFTIWQVCRNRCGAPHAQALCWALCSHPWFHQTHLCMWPVQLKYIHSLIKAAGKLNYSSTKRYCKQTAVGVVQGWAPRWIHPKSSVAVHKTNTISQDSFYRLASDYKVESIDGHIIVLTNSYWLQPDPQS